MSNSVQNLYKGWFGNRYDSMKRFWNNAVSSRAEKLLSNFLINNINNNSILELGCGTALNLKKIKSLDLNFDKYLGLDFSDEMLKKAKSKFKNTPNVQFKQQDITDLSNIKDKYDIIICTWVLSHMEYPSDVINQAQNLLKDKGKMFLIFLSKPKWYVYFWFSLIAKFLFQSKFITKREIQKINNIKHINYFSANLVTTIIISK